MKYRRTSWNSKKFLGFLRGFLYFKEISSKPVDAAQDAMPRDLLRLLVKPKEFHACEVAPRAPQNVRSAPEDQLFLGKSQEFHENHGNSWKCAGYPWNPMKDLGSRRNSLGMCKNFIRVPLSFTPPGPPAETTSKS